MSALSVIACCRPLDAPSLSADEAEATAQLFKTLGDPARVRILNVLATTEGPVCVCELTPALGLSQPTVSHHLGRRNGVGPLARRQRGVWAYYSIDPDAADRLGALADLKGGRR
jgi:ArsR family transcriptional regulator